MSLDGFDGHIEELEFSLGHVTGVRGFKQDALGRLTGVTHKRVFRPGVNVAECVRCKTENLATDACGQCGYYAYFEQDNPEDNQFYGGEIGAIVRGFGRTVVGTKGFRAEKADLVAFFPIDTVGEKRVPPATTSRRSPLRFLYPSLKTYKRWSNTPQSATVLIGSGVGGVLLLILTTSMFVVGAWNALLWLGLPSVVLLRWLAGAMDRGLDADLIRSWDTSDGYYRSLCRKVRGGLPETQTTGTRSLAGFEHLKSLYPGVPVYDTFREAVTEHPLTPADEHQLPEPTPENDPDFWTREVPPTNQFSRGGYVRPGSASVRINVRPHQRTASCRRGRCVQCIQRM